MKPVTVPVLALCLSLTACSGTGLDDLSIYADKVLARESTPIAEVPHFSTAEPFVPDFAAWADPFQPYFHNENRPKPRLPRPGAHRLEELERYPLDALRMVGILEQDNDQWALVRAPDGIVHKVLPGNYMGEEYGKVIYVAETHVDLREIIATNDGGWQERTARIRLSQ